MKRKSQLQCFLILTMVLTLLVMPLGCAKETAQTDSGMAAAIGSVKDVKAMYPAGSSMNLKFAKNFSIQYMEDGMKLVTDGQKRQMLLLQEGQQAPEEYKGLPTVTLPLSQAIYSSSTQVGYLRAFDNDRLFDSIVGVRMKAEDWDFDAMKNRMLSGQIKDIGDNTTSSTSYNHEIIQSLNPKLVFTSQGMGTEQQKLMEMLNQAGIPYLFDGSSTELDYRGTMEWLKFYAALYNLEKEADIYFDQAIARIDEMKEKVKDAPKPKVGWGIISMGKVYVENGGSKSAQMVRDAGAEYIFNDIGAGQDGVTSISVEELYNRLAEADIFLNRGMPKYGPDIKSITDQAPVLAELPCFKDKKVWQITDSYWSTYHNIDQKYIELAAIFHPDLYPDESFGNFILMPDVAE